MSPRWGAAREDTVSDKAQILIVEDDLDLSDMLRDFFDVQGYEVRTAAWGEDAIRLTTEHHPDIIVLDIRLPDIDGYEVCRRLRTQHRTHHMPIIFLTEKRDRVDKLAGLELGVVDYITKPFDIQELRLRVRNALRRASLAAPANPVTHLPEGPASDEALGALLAGDEDWALLLVSVAGLDAFREQYGFVAADDVLRAVGLMVRNTAREVGGSIEIGHLEPHDFVMITGEPSLSAVRERIEARLSQSLEFFYPLSDRDGATESPLSERLAMLIGQVTHREGPFDGVPALKSALLAARAPYRQGQPGCDGE